MRTRDYRDDQSRRDWWNERIPFAGGLTRNDLAWVVVGVLLTVLYFKFLPNMDWVFGLR